MSFTCTPPLHANFTPASVGVVVDVVVVDFGLCGLSWISRHLLWLRVFLRRLVENTLQVDMKTGTIFPPLPSPRRKTWSRCRATMHMGRSDAAARGQDGGGTGGGEGEGEG